MHFLANENFPLPSIQRLRGAGYDVAAISEESPGATDTEVLARASNEGRCILTFDKDYGELIYRTGLPHAVPVAFFRFDPLTPTEPADLLLHLLETVELSLEGQFTVIQRQHVPQRPLP
jgi:predicted nuclease of predicted toxin-antitoxin system